MKRIALATYLCTSAALVTAAPVVAGPPAFDLSWHTIDGGGGTSSAGGFALSGTIGQPDPGTASGGGWAVDGGFWVIGAGGGAPPCPSDIDGSGDVGFSDLLAILATWGACPGCPEDLDLDGMVGFSDLLQVLADWGPCP